LIGGAKMTSDAKEELESLFKQRIAEIMDDDENRGLQRERIEEIVDRLISFNRELIFRYEEKEKRTAELTDDLRKTMIDNESIIREEKYNRSLIEVSLDPLVTIGPDGEITDVNTATEKITGLSREKLIGTDFSDYFTDPQRAKEGYLQVFKNGVVFDYKLDLKHIDGFYTPVLYNATVYKDDAGMVVGVFAAARDITSTQKAEQELKYLKGNLELLVQQRTTELQNTQILLKSSLESPKGMIILSIDKDYNYLYFNQAHKDAMKYAYGRDVKPGMNLMEQMTSEIDRVNAKINYDLALQGNSHSTIQKYGDIAISYYETFYNTIRNDDNEIVGCSAFARDITDRINQEEKYKELNNTLEKRVQERTAQLASANKELEAFSYSVSHDLKAPLRHVTGYISLFKKKYGSMIPEESQQYLNNISASAKNMGELIDGLLQYSQVGRIDMNPRLLAMNEKVNALIQPIKELDVNHRIHWTVHAMPDGYGDSNMIKSVWNDLIENAVKFTAKKSIAEIKIGAYENEGETVYYVKDNGAGFDMSYIAKLFTVFQRLHSSDEFEGTGIGLASVRKIVQRHGGRTWAEGKVGEGATFYFSLLKRKENG
jgi:PAS domain S-box-containing protein